MSGKKEENKKLNKKTEKIIKESKILSDDELDELNEYINQKNSFLNIYQDYDSTSLLETEYELKGEFMKNDKQYYYN